MHKDKCEDLTITAHHFLPGYIVDNLTVVNISFKYTINVNYHEQIKMDFMDLFYNIDGKVGMWVGWSVASIIVSFSNFIVSKLNKLNIFLKNN